MCSRVYKTTSTSLHTSSLFSSQFLTLSVRRSHPLTLPPLFRRSFACKAFTGDCFLKENDLAIMAMKIFKLPAAVLLLLVIACIMLVAVQVTEAARELDDDIVGGALLSSDEQVPSIVANTAFQVAACKLLRLPCVFQSSGDQLGCIPKNGFCLGDITGCCKPMGCLIIPGICY